MNRAVSLLITLPKADTLCVRYIGSNFRHIPNVDTWAARCLAYLPTRLPLQDTRRPCSLFGLIDGAPDAGVARGDSAPPSGVVPGLRFTTSADNLFLMTQLYRYSKGFSLSLSRGNQQSSGGGVSPSFLVVLALKLIYCY